MSIKYWVYQLSNEAQTILYKHCKDKLIEHGYDKEVIDNYMTDLENEKLINLDELVSREMMMQLSEME